MTQLHCSHLKSDINQFLKSTASQMVDKKQIAKEMVDKYALKPTLADKLADVLAYMADKEQITTNEIVVYFGFTPTTAKRYLRQLAEFGYLESHGGNRNRTYIRKK